MFSESHCEFHDGQPVTMDDSMIPEVNPVLYL